MRGRAKAVLVSALALAAAAAGAVPALAADVIGEQAATAPTWTGFFLGAHAGLGGTRLDYTLLPVFPGEAGIPYRFGDHHFIYGIHAGADYQFNRFFVAGIEGSLTDLSNEYDPFGSGGFGELAEVKAAYAVSGRLGVLFSPETLVYGKLGYAGVRIEGEEDAGGTAKDTVSALLLGAGVETFLTGNLTGRVEALYLGAPSEFTIASDFEQFEPRTLLVTAGLSYRFGAQERAVAADPAPETAFNGFYLGIGAGGVVGQTNLDVDFPGASVGPYGDSSPLVDAFAGFDARFGRVVAGIEAEGTYFRLDFDDPAQNSNVPDGPTRFASVDGMFAVSGRVGFVATPSTLLYAKGGYAGFFTELNEDFFALDDGDKSDLLSGYQVGLGVETAISRHATLRVEGLFAEALDEITTNNTQDFQITVRPQFALAKIGLAYRF